MKRNSDFTDGSVMAVVRLQSDLRERALARARQEDVTFSQIMRRSLRRELESLESAQNTASQNAAAA